MEILGYKFFDKVENKISTKNNAKSVTRAILEMQKFRMREDLSTFELAVQNRDNIVNYNREDLHRIYLRAMQDPHITSQWDSRKLKTLKKEFFVMPKGSEDPNDDLTAMLQAPWFFEFVNAILDSQAWGFSLIEFGEWDGEKFIPYRNQKGKIHDDVELIDRDNVKPEYGIVTSTAGQSTGEDFTKDKYKNNIIFVGNKDNGWLYGAAIPFLIKNNTVQNWSEFAELFGMDVRAFKTDAQDEDLTKVKQALKAAVGGGSMIMGQEDSLEYIGTGRSDAYQVFKQLVDYQDSTISKLIFGQDVVANNTGNVVGEIGENVANDYGDADARWVKYIIEDKLFPLLSLRGVNMEGMTFEWGTKENLSLSERVDIDLKISQMGFTHSDDYINETYDTNVEETKDLDSANLTETKNALKELYNVGTNNTKQRIKY